jgi:hypothetical protein
MRRFAGIACTLIGVWLFVLGTAELYSLRYVDQLRTARREMAAGAVLFVGGWFLLQTKRG